MLQTLILFKPNSLLSHHQYYVRTRPHTCVSTLPIDDMIWLVLHSCHFLIQAAHVAARAVYQLSIMFFYTWIALQSY